MKITKDGRVIYDIKNASDMHEYRSLTLAMRERQNERCCLCGDWMSEESTTFEHQRSRGHGGAFRDDRIEIQGVRVNGASHALCNFQRGSKNTPFLLQ